MSDNTPDMMAGRKVSSSLSRPFPNQVTVHVEEEVVDILHCQTKVFDTQLVRQGRLFVEPAVFGRVSDNRHGTVQLAVAERSLF